MAIETTELTRSFKYNSIDLADPGPELSAEQVRDFSSTIYPEIVSAAIEGPEQTADKLVYTFRRAVGTKGSTRLQARLSAIASGQGRATGRTTLDEGFVAQHAPAFSAWAGFVRISQGGHRGQGRGESIPAPAGLITPLP